MLSLVLALITSSFADDHDESPVPCTETYSTLGTLEAALGSQPDGAVLCLEAGTYTVTGGNSFNRSVTLTIRGQGVENTLYKRDAGGHPLFAISGTGGLIFEDMTLENNVSGRAIFTVAGSATLEFHGARLRDSNNTGPGAVQLNPGTRLIATETLFDNNNATGTNDGGHIAATDARIELYDSVLRGGSARRGGAIHATDSDITIQGSHFIDQGAREYAGAIYAQDGTLDILDSTFLGNSAAGIGGAVFAEGSALDVEGSLFIDNTADLNGGALAVNGESFFLVDSTFYRNESSQSGGAVWLSDSRTDATGFARNNFLLNVASSQGGHVYVDASSAVSALQNRFYGGLAAEGGAMACVDSTCELTDSGLWGNRAEGMGAGGGGIYSDNASVRSVRSLFCANRHAVGVSYEGGGAILAHTGKTQTQNNLFVSNQAPNTFGGAIFQSGDGDGEELALSSTHDTFVGNQSAQGCVVYVSQQASALTYGLLNGNSCGALSEIGGGAEALPRQLYGEPPPVLGDGDPPPYEFLISYTGYDLPDGAAFGGRAVEGPGNLHSFDADLPDLSPYPFTISFTALADLDEEDLTFPLFIDEDCREIYDYLPESGDPLFDKDFGATSGDKNEFIDVDGDGWTWLFDCDDDNDEIQGPDYYYIDFDGDGFGDKDGDKLGPGCPPPGFVTNNLDCNDKDPDINPDAEEQCDDTDWNCS
ncbi:MAG: hypothetical protein EA397_17490, partial [Deltaproteobacteria bacterium]